MEYFPAWLAWSLGARVHTLPKIDTQILGLRPGVRSPGIYVYIYGEKIYVYIYFLGSFGNLASLGRRMNGK